MREGRAVPYKDLGWFLIFLACFAATVAARFVVDSHVVWVVASVLEGFCLIGFVEAFHQACHNNLLGRGRTNVIVGSLIGAMLGTSYPAYRRFHLLHHAFTNVDTDPEVDFFQKRSGRIATLLTVPLKVAGYSNVVNSAKYLARPRDLRLHKLCLGLTWAIRLLLVAFLVSDPRGFAFSVAIPFVVFTYLEFFITQSQHYESPVLRAAPRGMEHYAVSVNIAMPRFLAFLCLNTNMHATHHVGPARKWYTAYLDVAKDGKEKDIVAFSAFLRRWWKGGSKVWADLPIQS